MIKAVIFDVDGTLVDTVDIHAAAWQEAFRHFGHKFDYGSIRSQIGKGGDQLMPVFLSDDEIAKRGKQIEAFRSTLVKEKFFPRVHGFPCVRELMESLIDRHIEIVLASSAKKDELEFYKQVCGIDDIVRKETTSDDVELSKPHPDIFEAALALVPGVSRDDIIVVGNSPHDAEAARRAGLQTIGVLCGGFDKEDLRDARCVAIFHDPAHLLVKMDSWLRL